jgi:hypothetical protein
MYLPLLSEGKDVFFWYNSLGRAIVLRAVIAEIEPCQRLLSRT